MSIEREAEAERNQQIQRAKEEENERRAQEQKEKDSSSQTWRVAGAPKEPASTIAAAGTAAPAPTEKYRPPGKSFLRSIYIWRHHFT